jgi:hypothetical protein
MLRGGALVGAELELMLVSVLVIVCLGLSFNRQEWLRDGED